MSLSRPYTMRARADAVARTRDQIFRAGMALWEEKLTLAISLAEIAERADVTVRTVLRHFGSREHLFDELLVRAQADAMSERETPAGDIKAAVATIVSHYELRGDLVMRMLEEARVDERIASLVEHGRRFHRQWVRTVFAPQLSDSRDARAIEDLLVVATDVYTWKLLRRDAGVSRHATEARIKKLIDVLLGSEA